MHTNPGPTSFRQRRFLCLAASLASLCAALTACSDSVAVDSSNDAIDYDPPDVSAIDYSVADAMAENKADHDEDSDLTWDPSTEVTVTLAGTSIAVAGDGAEVDGTTVTITAPGTYRFTGTLDDGAVVVDSDADGVVRLIFDAVDVTNSAGAPVAVMKADKTAIVLADGTTNHLSDAAEYVFPDPEVDEPNAALFSKDDLTIGGNGSLTVDAHYNDGIASKDGLVVRGGRITVNAEDDGVRGKDYLVVKGGTLTVTSGGDGFKSDNDDDADCGYIWIQDGVVDVTAGDDALQAESDLLVSGGTITLLTAGGSTEPVSDDDSAKGLKAGYRLVFDDGALVADVADDAVHANAHVVINGGTLSLASGDDAIHADSTLGVNAGDIVITRSYEGLESIGVVIAGGNIWVASSDDGLNGAGDESAGMMGGDNYLHILGGTIAIYASGDGIDVNGSIVMTGGQVVIHGPTRQNNGAIDYDRSFQLTGGLLVAAGSAGMAQAPDASSGQYVVLLTSRSTQSAGTLIHIEDSSGNSVLSFMPSKQYGALSFSSASLAKGTYRVYLGGANSGSAVDGLYDAGTYSGGSQAAEFTISGVVTKVSF